MAKSAGDENLDALEHDEVIVSTDSLHELFKRMRNAEQVLVGEFGPPQDEPCGEEVIRQVIEDARPPEE